MPRPTRLDRTIKAALPALGLLITFSILLALAIISGEPVPTSEKLLAAVLGWLLALLQTAADTAAKPRVLAIAGFLMIWGTLRAILAELRSLNRRAGTGG